MAQALSWIVVAVLAAAGVWIARRVVDSGARRSESGVPLGLFRIAFALAMGGELVQLWVQEPLVSGRALAPGFEFSLRYVLAAWILVDVCLLLGWRTRLAAALGFAFTLGTFSVFRQFEYHVDYIYTAVNAVFLVAPVEQRLSLDRLRAVRAASKGDVDHEPPTTVPVIYRRLLIALGIGVIYLDSVFFKSVSPMWTGGLGVWMPASVPVTTWVDGTLLLDQRWLVLGLGYLTLVFETAFLFLMWSRRAAPWLLPVGLGLHLGILVAFPIPWFAFTMLSLYLLVVPPDWWTAIGARLRRAAPDLRFFYDEECPLCRRTRRTVQHFDVRGRVEFLGVQEHADACEALRDVPRPDLLRDVHAVLPDGRVVRGVETYRQVALATPLLRPIGWLLALPPFATVAGAIYRRIADTRAREGCTEQSCALPTAAAEPLAWTPVVAPQRRRVLVAALALVVLCQLCSTTLSLGARKLARSENLGNVYGPWRTVASAVVNNVGRPLFGIAPHGVFMDQHFRAQQYVFAIVHVAEDGHRTWLPITRESGLVHPANNGRLWVEWTFRTPIGLPLPADSRRNLANRTAHWLMSNGLSTRAARFELLAKDLDTLGGWEQGYLRRQLERPWRPVGELRWTAGDFDVSLDASLRPTR